MELTWLADYLDVNYEGVKAFKMIPSFLVWATDCMVVPFTEMGLEEKEEQLMGEGRVEMY